MKKLTDIGGRMTGLMIFTLLIVLASCTSNGTTGSVDSLSATHDNDDHADNDIAMTIRSIMDALTVDQPLDSAEYNFQGILTDGSGRPLYTDIQGAPGQWSVEVLSANAARIKNLYLGDLVPEELSQYLLTSLEIPDSLMVSEYSIGRHGSETSIYDFGQGQLIFETLTAKTESGHSGPLVNILLLKKHTEEIPS